MQNFDYTQLFIKYRYLLVLGATGLLLIAGGIFINKSGILAPSTKVEVLSESTQSGSPKTITVEISGQVVKTGVYKMTDGSRVDDLILTAGGFNGREDRFWIEKYLNRAAKITDGQKIYIPGTDEQSGSSSAKSGVVYQSVSTTNSSDSKHVINVNTGSLQELDTLPGIGPVFGQNIIDHRPYSNVEELVSKGVIRQSVYQKLKSLVTVY